MDELRRLFNSPPANYAVSTRTVSTLDTGRYLGMWYDVGHIPQPYQNNCTSSIAVYLPEDGKMVVKNYCYSGSSIKESITGEATVADPRDPGKLVVKFEGLIYKRRGNYWIYDTDYVTYSLVGDGKGEAFWILAREPSISTDLLRQLLSKIAALGYDTKHLTLKQPKY